MTTEFKPLDRVLVDGTPATFQQYDERNGRPGHRPMAWVHLGDFVRKVPVACLARDERAG